MAAIAKLPMYIKRDWVAACTQRLLPVADQYTLSLPRPCNWVVTIIDRAQLPSLSTALQQWTLVTCHHMICGILPTIAPFLWNSCSTLWKSLQCDAMLPLMTPCKTTERDSSKTDLYIDESLSVACTQRLSPAVAPQVLREKFRK